MGDDEFSFPFPEREALLEQIEELTREGTSPGAIERAKKRYDELANAFPVWEENRPTVAAFLRVRTQWITGASGATGLNYPAVTDVLRRMRLGDDEDRIFEDLQRMESAIVAEWAKESDRRAREHEGKRGRL